MANNYPVVLVHGIFGFGPKELWPINYWGLARLVDSSLSRHEASVGPISSAHDRACELAAQIKGTRTDFGAQHALDEGHERFGRDFTGKGFEPDWSEENAVHLVGHSLGSPTIRCLQHLLAQDYWGWHSNDRWIRSLTTISGVTNGSTLTYLAGADEQTGLLDGESAAVALMFLIETYMYATHAVHESLYDFDLQHWGFQRRDDERLVDYLLRVGSSQFMLGRDNACYSLTLQGAYADNSVWPTFPDTYYFSIVTEQTFRGLSGHYYPSPLMAAGMAPMAAYMGRKAFKQSPIPTEDFCSADWWESDGMVPSYSQKYPHVSGDHPLGGEFNAETPSNRFKAGKWYYMWLRDTDHLDICLSPEPLQFGQQRRFYASLFERLASL